jgi:hypothetical protein
METRNGGFASERQDAGANIHAILSRRRLGAQTWRPVRLGKNALQLKLGTREIWAQEAREAIFAMISTIPCWNWATCSSIRVRHSARSKRPPPFLAPHSFRCKGANGLENSRHGRWAPDRRNCEARDARLATKEGFLHPESI